MEKTCKENEYKCTGNEGCKGKLKCYEEIEENALRGYDLSSLMGSDWFCYDPSKTCKLEGRNNFLPSGPKSRETSRSSGRSLT